jgi:hypothetical protein
VKGGTYIYECYPDLDAMFEQQAVELDRGKRAEILARMQQILYETGDRHASRSLPSSMASDLGSASPISTGSQSSRIRRRMKTWR